jgi:heptosyltransferase III
VSPAPHAGDQNTGRDSKLKRLLIRPGAIGDTIVSLPALEFCRAEYTEVWSSVPLIQFADRVRSIASTGLDLLELGVDDRAGKDLRRFDSILSWYGTNRPEFRNCVADLPFTFFPALPADSKCHAVDFYMRQAGGPDGAVPRLDPGPVSKRDIIAIHPFSGSARKNWPLWAFAALTERLPLPVEFAAGPEETLEGARRFDDLWDLARWLAGARLYIGNDSGVSHLAAAVGTPVIAVFRTTDPAVWAPRGRAPVEIVLSEPDSHQEDAEIAGIARHAERLIELDHQT